MKTFYTFTVCGEEYKLRLTASAIMQIEKKLGRSMFDVIQNIQDNAVENLTTIIWGAAQYFHKNFTTEQAATLFDNFIDEENTIQDLVKEAEHILIASGFLNKEQT